ncbi:hypothetical protein Axy20_024 [Achromobacter phage vB_AxyS_19-32_Axy20]|nr:hypothetical protein Axy18_023 [Achromobacter phage vB_AxyS_19-32_Axy18]QDH84542.1 hypothetical protein Axy20_024 [Achromobacter phage vB_AxyS_19-32_Axy20]
MRNKLEAVFEVSVLIAMTLVAWSASAAILYIVYLVCTVI